MYAVKNKFYKHSKLDEQCFRSILQLFAMDLTAVQCARLSGVNVRSVNSIFLKLRERIAQWCEKQALRTPGLDATPYEYLSQLDATAVEIGNSSYLQSEADGVVGFRLYVNGDKVYCTQLQSANDTDMSPAGSTQSAWRVYPVGVDLRQDMKLKIKHVTQQRAHQAGDADRIEAFARYLRLRLGKFKGLRRGKFYVHLKESEYRFNHRRYELYTLLLGMLGEQPIE